MAPDDKIYKEARKRVRRRRKFYSHVLTYLAMPRFSHSSIGTAILANVTNETQLVENDFNSRLVSIFKLINFQICLQSGRFEN